MDGGGGFAAFIVVQVLLFQVGVGGAQHQLAADALVQGAVAVFAFVLR